MTLCGVLNTSGGSVLQLPALDRLRRLAAGAEPIICGPLAVAGAGPLAQLGRADGITCVIEGRLHNLSSVAAGHGLGPGTAPQLLARCYRRSGSQLLTRLRGGYSLVIWDETRRSGVLACDLLCVRPLLLWRGAGWLAFASELTELLQILPTRPAPDADGVLLWLTEGRCPADRTLYEGVSRLGPGELVEVAAPAMTIGRYWRPRYDGGITGSRAELAAGLRERLAQSTARRLFPGPIGVVLSGGLDSSIVTAMASRGAPVGTSLRTYSAVFPGAEFDEREKVACLARELELDAAAFELEPRGTIWLALQHTRQWQLPLMGAGALIDIGAVGRAAREGAEMVLDGQTGDEVLGFSPFLLADHVARARWLEAFRLIQRCRSADPPPGRRGHGCSSTWVSRAPPPTASAAPSIVSAIRRRDRAGCERNFVGVTLNWRTSGPGSGTGRDHGGGAIWPTGSSGDRTASCASTTCAIGRRPWESSPSRRCTTST